MGFKKFTTQNLSVSLRFDGAVYIWRSRRPPHRSLRNWEFEISFQVWLNSQIECVFPVVREKVLESSWKNIWKMNWCEEFWLEWKSVVDNWGSFLSLLWFPSSSLSLFHWKEKRQERWVEGEVQWRESRISSFLSWLRQTYYSTSTHEVYFICITSWGKEKVDPSQLSSLGGDD